ncbi:MAG: nucleotidyl transferase AbiEii/AbiGii toxin family protein [candidate division WOR-3 bacterium]
MKFIKVLSSLTKNFEKHNVRYALIGGFSLFVFGIPRTTVDLDFLINKEDLEKLDKIMDKLGYKLIFRTDNVSQYAGKTKELGGIDFIHGFRKYALAMLARARKWKIKDIEIKVLQPEDIIGLKVQAIANKPERKNRELADIESILEKFSKNIDWELLKEYFHLFGFDKDFNELKKRYG